MTSEGQGQRGPGDDELRESAGHTENLTGVGTFVRDHKGLRGRPRTYLINALGSPKSLKKRPFRSGPTIYENGF